jgi:hypothetical protein
VRKRHAPSSSRVLRSRGTAPLNKVSSFPNTPNVLLRIRQPESFGFSVRPAMIGDGLISWESRSAARSSTFCSCVAADAPRAHKSRRSRLSYYSRGVFPGRGTAASRACRERPSVTEDDRCGPLTNPKRRVLCDANAHAVTRRRWTATVNDVVYAGANDRGGTRRLVRRRVVG